MWCSVLGLLWMIPLSNLLRTLFEPKDMYFCRRGLCMNSNATLFKPRRLIVDGKKCWSSAHRLLNSHTLSWSDPLLASVLTLLRLARIHFQAALVPTSNLFLFLQSPELASSFAELDEHQSCGHSSSSCACFRSHRLLFVLFSKNRKKLHFR